MDILIVDDDAISAQLLQYALDQLGYTVSVCHNGREALALARSWSFPIIICDWEMPEMDGVELCRQIRQRQSGLYTYIILLTVHTGTENTIEALEAGADEFLSKPFHPQELHVRLRVAERMLGLQSRDVTIFCLAKLAESRDPETGAHLERMREYSRILADQLATHPKYADLVDGDFVQLVYQTAPLHDIGKVGIPDAVLLKAGKLTPDEFEIMKQHAVIGAETLEAAVQAYPAARYLQMAREIALSHHEKFDGSGYPQGLQGSEIPLSARIVALADVYDALTSKRVYKDAFSHEAAKEIILEGCATHFDPDVVEAFLEREADFIAIKENEQHLPSIAATGRPAVFATRQRGRASSMPARDTVAAAAMAE